MKGNMSLYYDEEGDYLEIFIEGKSPTYGEEMDRNTTILREESTNEIVGIAILNFKKRTKSLQDIKVNLPFGVNFSTLQAS